MIRIKRIYEPANRVDGYRILVDRLWPRGLPKQKARVDLWLKEVSPSKKLRKWYGHDPKRWQEVRTKYQTELRAKKKLVQQVEQAEKEHGTVTLFLQPRMQRETTPSFSWKP